MARKRVVTGQCAAGRRHRLSSRTSGNHSESRTVTAALSGRQSGIVWFDDLDAACAHRQAYAANTWRADRDARDVPG